MNIAFTARRSYVTVGEPIADTGNSVIYKGLDTTLKRTVGIKCIEIPGDTPLQRRRNLQMIEKEAAIMVLLGEDTVHIPCVFDAYTTPDNTHYYLFMQWIDGETLREKMPQIAPYQFIDYLIKLCDILSVIERRKRNHKDIKPENIMIDSKNELFLLDFNITDSLPNTVEGTQHYKAPEMGYQIKSVSRNHCDIFAVGVMMYEYFAKVLPTRGSTYSFSRLDIGHGAQWKKFTEPGEVVPDIHPLANEIIVRCMKLSPEERYSRAGELQRQLFKLKKEFRRK